MKMLIDLVGKSLIVAIENSERSHYEIVLRGAEHGGIWAESPDLELMFGHEPTRKKRITTVPPTKPLFFIPFARMIWLIAASVDLDESSFSE